MTSQACDSWPEGSFLDLLPSPARAVLLSKGVRIQFGDDEVLVLQGTVGRYLYALTSGLVKVLVAAESGTETALAVLSRGDLVGEFALVDDRPRSATARAVGTVTAVRVSRPNWEVLLREHQEVEHTLSRYLLGKMRQTTERRAAERVWEAGHRIVQVLCELAAAYGERASDGTIRLPLTQGELAQLAGVAVSTTERELSVLRGQGAIATRYGVIVVKDMTQLRALRFPEKTDENP